jgi:SAM-dependent methyltransferase
MRPALTPMARLRYDRIRALMPPLARTVLEIGCGEGAVGYRLSRHYSYVGIDQDEQSCAVAQRRIGDRGDVFCGDTSVVAGEQFDVVCAFEVLEHIDRDRRALKSWVEFIRPGGYLLVSVPADPSRFGASDEFVGHYRRYTADGLQSLLGDVGLSDLRLALYGAPLGYALESVRNRVLARRTAATSQADRTAASGRLLQPHNPLVGAATGLAVAPFAVVQRAFPARGVGIVARGRRL